MGGQRGNHRVNKGSKGVLGAEGQLRGQSRGQRAPRGNEGVKGHPKGRSEGPLKGQKESQRGRWAPFGTIEDQGQYTI